VRQFKRRTLYDQWLLALDENYQNHNYVVNKFIEENKESSKNQIISQIKKDCDLRVSVNYMLDWWGVIATSIKYRIGRHKNSFPENLGKKDFTYRILSLGSSPD
jgi:hypothetical protein